MKIFVAGCGKRFTNIYHKIFKSLNFDIFLWNRTISKSYEFCKKENCNFVENLKEIEKISPDLVISFLPPETHFEFSNFFAQNCSCPILLETPGLEARIIRNQRIGSLEQWPFLPIEQFKELIYQKKIIERPYFAINDGRSFDYHAIAQLRKNLGMPIPEIAKASSVVGRNDGVISSSGELNLKPSEWLTGTLEMSGNSLISYNFSYNCKSNLSIPFQLLRNVSSDGCISSGRSKNMGDDYEIIDVRTVDKETRKVKIHDVFFERENNVTRSIKIEDLNVEWFNPYEKFNFDDQQTAIATLIENSFNSPHYTYEQSYIDNLCILMMKNSSYSQQVVRLK